MPFYDMIVMQSIKCNLKKFYNFYRNGVIKRILILCAYKKIFEIQ